VLAILQLLVRFLKSLAAEEHLPSEEQRNHEDRDSPKVNASTAEDLGQDYTEDSQTQVANHELT
jgi:hypothetical protein